MALSIQHRSIQVEVNDDGLYVFNEKTKELLYMCRYLNLTKVLTNILTGDVEIELEYVHNGSIRTMICPRDTLIKNKLLNVLPTKGIDVTDSNVFAVLAYLLSCEESADYVYFHDKLGWNYVGSERAFLLHEVIGSNFNSEYMGDLNIKPKGSFEGWKKTVDEEVLGNPALELALVLGLSSPVASLFRSLLGLDVLFFHIYGHSTTGKTTCLIVAISPFGLPSKGNNGLIKTWLATDNAILGNIKGLHGLPMAIDEASVKSHKDFSSMVYQLTDGIDKARLDRNANSKKRGEWSGTIISTGESSLLTNCNQNNGLRVRLLELGQISWTTSAENADHLKNQMSVNYGHAGIKFIECLLKYCDEALIDKFSICKKLVKEKMRVIDNFSDRIADKIAVIYLTALITNEALNLELSIEKILDILLDADSASAGDRNIGLKAYEFICSEITRNVNKFVFKNDLNSLDSTGVCASKELPHGEIFGRLETKDYQFTEALIPKDRLKTLLTEGGYTDIDLILSQWRTDKLISTDEGKFTMKRKILDKGTSQRVVVIKLNISSSKGKKEIKVLNAIKADKAAKNVTQALFKEF